ncbi:MAG: chemotaxis protein CheA [Sterolibacterium sp.]|jgi:two-component system chemotaxis sensor kinase CheA|nr:chemotaxis protein CheA [Sterolibacterium sp.]
MSLQNDLDGLLQEFVEEARELIAQMEEILLRAESGDCTSEDMNALFRCAHTIKGSGGLFALDEVVRFTHIVESVLVRLRNGVFVFTPELVSVLLESQDHISQLIAAVAVGEVQDAARSDWLIQKLLPWSATDEAQTGGALVVPPADDAGVTVEVGVAGEAFGAEHWHISMRCKPGVLADGMDPLSFINYLSRQGRIVHVETVTDALPDFEAADPESCYLGFEVALESTASKAELESVFEFIAENALIVILPPNSKISEYLDLIASLPEDRQRLGEILVACGTLTPRELEQALAAQKSSASASLLGEILEDQIKVAPVLVDAAVKKQRNIEEKHATENKNVRVPAERLDALIDRIGELVIAGAGSHAQAMKTRQPAMQESASQLLALVEDIRDKVLSLRMVAIGEVFSRFPRVVRDVSRELGKEIELKITGAEAELDKSMIEKIADPLMHLVRNAMDHGIESVEQRMAAGKPTRGTLSLDAYHESGLIVIQVKDDGRGLDTARILAKAIEKGLVVEGAALSEQEIFRLILEPGFSTADKVSNLSGRGVGMDVVRSNVEALRGTLDIHSTLGQGTLIRLCLPLTLAIIDGFHVGVGGAQFIVPLDMVVECIELQVANDQVDYMELREEALPFVRLRQLFGESGPAHARPRVVVVRFAGKTVGLVVDRIYGKCQTVIKPLGPLFENVPCVSGSTILGDGEVALIIDVAQLVNEVVGREWRGNRSAPALPRSAVAAAV